jgi:hypothetical protein
VWATTHHAAWLDFVMAGLSLAGRAGLVWLVIAATVAIRRPRMLPLFWQVVLVVLLAYFTVDLVLKPAIARARPFETVLDARVVGSRPATYSFPSGHAASAIAGAFVTTLMAPRARALLWALAVLSPHRASTSACTTHSMSLRVRAWDAAWPSWSPEDAHAIVRARSKLPTAQWRGSSVGRAPD